MKLDYDLIRELLFIIIFVFLINFAVHSFSHQAQPEPRQCAHQKCYYSWA